MSDHKPAGGINLDSMLAKTTVASQNSPTGQANPSATSASTSGQGKDKLNQLGHKLEEKANQLLGKLPALKAPVFNWPNIEAPAPFPTTVGGRLPTSLQEIITNRGSQYPCSPAEMTDANGQQRKPKVCRKTLKISLFFDGTNSHEKADKAVMGTPPTEEELKQHHKQAPQGQLIQPLVYPRTTNVARLYHACIGFEGSRSQQPADPNQQKLREKGWFKYYMQGIGTRFEEIGDMEPSEWNQAFGVYGEQRISWGLTRLCHALVNCNCFELIPFELQQAQQMIRSMGSTAGRQQALDQFLQQLRRSANGPELQGIQLYIIGAGRGAAEARTMVNWLSDYLLSRDENADAKALMLQQQQQRQAQQKQAQQQAKDSAKQQPTTPSPSVVTTSSTNGGTTTITTTITNNSPAKPAAPTPAAPAPTLKLLDIPIKVELLGLFDTVASVTLPPAIPMATGHMGWASATMSLTQPAASGLVSNIMHMVAAHEQRRNYALESVCINKGYPQGEVHEVVYPGAHADVGGGHAPGEQYRANFGMGHNLAQIPLHDMYAKAFALGMPLQVDLDQPQLAAAIKKRTQTQSKPVLESYELMDKGTQKEFDVQPELVARFNQWCGKLKVQNISQTVNTQVHDATGWRILRWIRNDVAGYADFLGLNSDSTDPSNRGDSATAEARDKILRAKRRVANSQYAGMEPPDDGISDADWEAAGWTGQKNNAAFFNDLLNKNYSASHDGWDMLTAAREFNGDYLHQFQLQSFSMGMLLDTFMGHTVSLLNTDDEAKEFEAIHQAGTQIYFGGPGTVVVPGVDVASPAATAGAAVGAAIGGNAGAASGATAAAKAAGTGVAAAGPDNRGVGQMIKDADLGAAVTGAVLTGLKQHQKGIKGGKLVLSVGKDLWKRVQQKDGRKMVALKKQIREKQELFSQQQEITSLYDEQVHDGRAATVHGPILKREPFSNYFRYRLIYSGSQSNKPLSGAMLGDRILGLTGIATSAYMSIKYHSPAYLLLGLTNPEMFVSQDAQKALKAAMQSYDRLLIDPVTGQITASAGNVGAIWDFVTNIKDTVEHVINNPTLQKPLTPDQIQNGFLEHVESNLEGTAKNLSEIRKLLLQQHAAAKKAGNVPLQQKTATMIKQLDERLAAIQNQSTADGAATDASSLLRQVSDAGTLVAESDRGPAALSPVAAGQYIQQQLSTYQQPEGALGIISAEGWAALNQTRLNITQTALSQLGIEHDVNEYLSAYIVLNKQPALRTLSQQLAQGQLPVELQDWAPDRIQHMQQAVAQYLQLFVD